MHACARRVGQDPAQTFLTAALSCASRQFIDLKNTSKLIGVDLLTENALLSSAAVDAKCATLVSLSLRRSPCFAQSCMLHSCSGAEIYASRAAPSAVAPFVDVTWIDSGEFHVQLPSRWLWRRATDTGCM